MKKYILYITILSLLSISTSLSQKYVDENSAPLERLYFGGNFGASFSTNFTQVEVSPIVGYMITDRVSAGVGVIYQYIKGVRYAPSGAVFSINTSIYGGKLFGRYNFTDQIFGYTEFEAISFEIGRDSNNELIRQVVPSYFIGAGYFFPITDRAGIAAMALYNILYDAYTSPYNSPLVLRIGFTF